MQQPLMRDRAIEFFGQFLRPDMTCLEWGMGGSTLRFGKEVDRWYSLEHNSQWYHDIMHQVSELGLAKKIIGKLCSSGSWDSVRRWTDGDPRWPKRWADLERTMKAYGWKDYCTGFKHFGTVTFDLVFVDGRARPECVKQIVESGRLEGILLVHDWKKHRSHYNVILERMKLVEQHSGLAAFECR